MRTLLLSLVLALTAGPAAADALQDYNRAVGAAMNHVRLAQFYLRTGNLAVAGTELDQATEKWAGVTATFAAKPPGKLAGDAAFRGDLDAVAGALGAALAAVDGDERDAAVRHLKPVAGRLVALRKRHGLWIYSDCIAAMNRAMDGAWVYRRKPPDFADAAQVAEMDKRLAALAHWYKTVLPRSRPARTCQSRLRTAVPRQPGEHRPPAARRQRQERRSHDQQSARAEILRPADLAVSRLERVRFYRNRRRSRGRPLRQAGIAGAGSKPAPAALGPHTGRA